MDAASWSARFATLCGHAASNDYSRTRTWKVIQKLTLLRDETTRSPHNGHYRYAPLPRPSSEDDPWERAHTLRSPEEFVEKVCRSSSERPVLVKYRQGRRYPCGDAFPDPAGGETRLDACVAKSAGEAPVASICADGTTSR